MQRIDKHFGAFRDTPPLARPLQPLFRRPSTLTRNCNFMDNQTKLRIGGLLVLTTAVLSLIIVLIVDSWPLAILLAVIIVAAAAGGFVWTSRRHRPRKRPHQRSQPAPYVPQRRPAPKRRDNVGLPVAKMFGRRSARHVQKTPDPSGNEPDGSPAGARTKTPPPLIPPTQRSSENGCGSFARTKHSVFQTTFLPSRPP